VLKTFIKLPSNQGNYIALWKIRAEHIEANKHIFLTHGTFSNRKVCLAVADYFSQKGYVCWIMEWRNHGDSSITKEKYNFETIGKEDVKLVFEYLIHELKIQKLNCITHSGGGVCLTIFLLNNPSYKNYIERIAFFGCQTSGAAHSLKNKLKILFAKLLSGLFGYLPSQKIGRPHNEDHYFMKQWYDWNLEANFVGFSGINYEKMLPEISIPIFSICGKGDLLVAPEMGCQQFLNAFNNPKNRFLCCGKKTGFREDYNHSRVLHSRNASEEIYPLVLGFFLDGEW